VSRAGDPGAQDGGLAWQVHPLTEAPAVKSVTLTGIVLGLSVAVGLSFGGFGYGFLCLAILAGSLSRYFVPTRYRADEAGVETSHLGVRRRVAWHQVRRAFVVPDGICLSPFASPNRLEAFRATFVRFGRHREAVLRYVRDRCTLVSD
jgi:hypothetical protein